MLALIEMDRALEAHRTVEHLDLGRALRDSVDVGLERPVEHDVRRPAVEARIVGGRKIQSCDRGRARGRERQLAAALVPVRIDGIVGERDGGAARARESLAASRDVARSVGLSGRERHERALLAARIRHHALLARPIARDVRIAVREPRGPIFSRGGRGSSGRELPLAIAVEAAAIGEARRAQVARVRVAPIGRSRNLDRVARLEHRLVTNRSASTPSRRASRSAYEQPSRPPRARRSAATSADSRTRRS